MIAGRRRTDVPDALWRGTAVELSDHPTQAGRDRTDRHREGLFPPDTDPVRSPASGPSAAGVRPRDDARQISRSRLPLPPVPAPSRGAVPAARTAPPVGPLTTAAPFRAVPSPELRPELPGDGAMASLQPAVADAPSGGFPSEASASSTPVAHVPHPGFLDGDPPVPSEWTGDSPVASEWTPAAAAVAPGEPAGDLLVHPAPATTAIPERSVAGRRGRSADPVEDEAPLAARGPSPGAGSGRAAMRAERQAADMARRKAVKRSGGPTSALPDEEEPRKPRGVLRGLAAMAVVGLGVLGVYTYAWPTPQDASAHTPAVFTPAPSSVPVTNDLPPLPTEPVVEPTSTVPVRVPVTVLNATDINGLAGKISAAVVGAGWEAAGVGAYTGGDVAVSTVFFTEGDENQRQAALQLTEQFPLSGPAPRFFELPPEVAVPGLVVVAVGEWQP